jgi:hypothetical protein
VLYLLLLPYKTPNPVATRSKAWVCCRPLASIAGSNPAGKWMSVSFECSVLSADHMSRGDLPNVVCLSVNLNPR